MPGELVDEAVEKTGLSRKEICEERNLGRGVPHDENINHLAIKASQLAYLVLYPNGHPKYNSGKKGVETDPNAFRGDEQYLDLIVTNLSGNWDLDIDKDQILTGTQGGQDLSTRAHEYFINAEKRKPILPRLTYDRAIKDLTSKTEDVQYASPINITKDGIDLNQFESALKAHESSNGSFFPVVNLGGNPDGNSIPIDNMVEALKLCRKYNGVIMGDEAYANLFYDEEYRTLMTPLKEFVDSGHFTFVRTATKEGGDRGPAYMIGSKERMAKMLNHKSHQTLSPIYRLQLEHVLAETYTREGFMRYAGLVEDALKASIEVANPEDRTDAERLLVKLKAQGIVPMEHFRQIQVRPFLKEGFEALKAELDEGGIELTNPHVTHGYNDIVKAPEDATDEQEAAILKQLGIFRTKSKNIDHFRVGDQKLIRGLRVPTGGFSPKQNRINGIVIKYAFKEVLG